MISDYLRQQRRYREIHPGLELAFDYLLKFDPQTADGKYELDGDRVFAMVQSYVTKPAADKKYEAHLRFIDLQFIVSGEEIIYHQPLDRLTLTDPYNDAKDYSLYRGKDSQALNLKSGDFSILFPHDGHKPGCTWQQEQTIKKVVIKIAV